MLVIGDVYTEVHESADDGGYSLRLGGIIHAARALFALRRPYGLACIAPTYIRDAIRHAATRLECSDITFVASVEGAPNLIIVRDPTEAGDQGYELVLRHERRTRIDRRSFQRLLDSTSHREILVFPAPQILEPIISHLAQTSLLVHVDIHYDVDDPDLLRALGRPFETVLVSTSADIFHHRWDGSVHAMCSELIPECAKRVILKENRGGARLFLDSEGTRFTSAPAHPRRTIHSVGVGDCFDAVFLERSQVVDVDQALAYASYISAEYASTLGTGQFVSSVSRALKIPPGRISELSGVTLPWEERPKHEIYLAAPDFEDVNRAPLERLVACLRYHNFAVRLPVREHGIVRPGDSPEKENATFRADLGLLTECSILVAALLYNDPGTLVEIGLAAAMQKPVIVYDPYRIAENLMLRKLPSIVSSDMAAVIGAVYEQASLVASRKENRGDE
jgi:nucleoside 2-deoxyribosyltransferase/sugar/nucleoside kinase (ribokinase family)